MFLRIHPTGKMVLSLTTEADGNEGDYAQLVASELGVPGARRQGRPGRREPLRRRARVQHRARPTASRRRSPPRPSGSAPRRSCWRARRSRPTRTRCGGRTASSSAPPARARSPTSPSTPTARASCRPGSRAGSTRRPSTGDTLGPENGTLTVRTGKGGAASKAGHNLVLEVQRWQGSLTPEEVTLTADARSLRVVSGSGGISPLGDDEKRRDRADDRRGGARGRQHRLPLERRHRPRGRLRRRRRARPARRLAPALVRAAARRRPPHRPRPGQADRLQAQAVLGAVRDPEGRRRRRGHDRRHPPERHADG